ncbi:MAG: HNH endonuclease [Pirellulales bacterium]|nr:HNH endonuclease [Pirellulales bacterium]
MRGQTGRLYVHRVRTAKQRSPRRSHSSAAQSADEPSAQPFPANSPLHSSVLVLNRLYMAIHIVNVRRAFGLLFRDLAEVIHLEEGKFANHDFESWREVSGLRADEKRPHDDWIRAVNFEIQVPRVIRLLGFDRIPTQTLHLSRRSVLARDDNVCQYCGRRLPTHQLSLDHVTPRSRGGMTTWENVVCACLKCNIKKGGRTPREAKMTLMRRPARPKRNPILMLKLSNPKYESWKTWLDGVQWNLRFGQ